MATVAFVPTGISFYSGTRGVHKSRGCRIFGCRFCFSIAMESPLQLRVQSCRTNTRAYIYHRPSYLYREIPGRWRQIASNHRHVRERGPTHNFPPIRGLSTTGHRLHAHPHSIKPRTPRTLRCPSLSLFLSFFLFSLLPSPLVPIIPLLREFLDFLVLFLSFSRCPNEMHTPYFASLFFNVVEKQR